MIEKMQVSLSGELRAMGNKKFLFYPKHSPVILQLECLHQKQLLVYCSFARDGSGLFLSSFMTLLLTEDVGAVSPSALSGGTSPGCVTGYVSQTYFRLLPSKEKASSALQAKKLAAACSLFAEEMKKISAELYDKRPLSDDRLPSCNLADFRIAHLMDNLDEA